MLDKRVEEMGDKTLIVFESGEGWSYKEMQHQARATAAALQRIGVARSEPVLVWMPSTSDIVRIHFGLSYLGAIFVPINLALKGATLEHIIRNSGAKLIICHADLVGRLGAVDLGALESIVIMGGDAARPGGLTKYSEDVLAPKDENFLEPNPPVQPWEPHGIFYTSGTTGISKGVIVTHVHTSVMGWIHLRFFKEDDRFLMNLPYFHLGAALVPFGAVGRGVSMALMQDFQTHTFMDIVRKTGSTSCFLLGAVSNFLMIQAPTPNDADNPLRTVIQVPLAHDSLEFSRRFGVDIHTVIDMTEMGPAIMSDILPKDRPMQHGYCGRPQDIWPHFDVRLVDENDNEVPHGEVGELVARCDMPWVISPGYWNMPEATAKAWRNGWFHTGDSLRRGADGNYYFVDRVKDSLRRRGENISSAELESEILQYEGVSNAAVIAARGEFAEDEVMVVIEPKPGAKVDPVKLTEFLIPRIPHFMVPRFIRIVEKMPYTETHKVQKTKLRADGITADTWDREKAGIAVKRQRIGVKS
jgi:crotonobetaine/carnitine-CoA ligase